ncbi:MAG: hypothetical protein EOO75_06120 [Myxococcales bacterium]|nr:MAG: hypothetical protein EOO75_06120 [Myxococcales bacterium]
MTSISLPHHVSGTRARSVTPLSDGHRFAVVTRGGAALCNAADGTRTRPVRVAPSRAHAVSHDGRWLVTLQHPADRGTVVITALDGRERLRPTGVHDDFNHIVAFVPGTHRLQMLFGDGSSSGHGFSIREYDLDAPAGRGPGDGGDVAIALAETERLEGDPILTMLHDPARRRAQRTRTSTRPCPRSSRCRRTAIERWPWRPTPTRATTSRRRCWSRSAIASRCT